MKYATLLIVSVVVSLFLVGCTGDTMNRTAVFKTNMGTFTIELFEDKMPITTANFIKLAEEGYYDGQRFHRIIGPAKAPPLGFMIQGGDPQSKEVSKKQLWGTGGPGYKIKDEFHDELSNVRGTISMANAGPNTGGSQFFINLGDNVFLDHNKQPMSSKHPVFGKVTQGMDVVDKIGAVRTEGPDRPVEDVIIEKVTIQ